MPDPHAPALTAKAPADKLSGPARGLRKLGDGALSGPARALRKLGLVRDIDLALHLPLRHEDETQLRPIASLRDGIRAQVQGTVLECRVETRSRRQLVVRMADQSGELLLRLLHFYPSNQKTLAVGNLVREIGRASCRERV